MKATLTEIYDIIYKKIEEIEKIRDDAEILCNRQKNVITVAYN